MVLLKRRTPSRSPLAPRTPVVSGSSPTDVAELCRSLAGRDDSHPRSLSAGLQWDGRGLSGHGRMFGAAAEVWPGVRRLGVAAVVSGYTKHLLTFHVPVECAVDVEEGVPFPMTR